MARPFLLAAACAMALGLSTADAAANSITEQDISIPGPAVLQHGARVVASFGYEVSTPNGARIFVRPMWRGQLAPNYSASGSKVYRRGRGSAEARFTISRGDVDIDGVRFQMVDAVTEAVLRERIIPVRLRFTGDPLAPCVQSNICSEGAVTGRAVQPDGSVEISFADGSKEIRHPGGGVTRIRPDGTMSILSAITLQPPPAPTATSAPDTAWLASLDAWLDAMGQSMLFDIESKASDAQSFVNYQNLEDAETQTLYERVEMRRKFLSLLNR